MRFSVGLITVLMSACGALGGPFDAGSADASASGDAGRAFDEGQVMPGDGGSNKTRIDAGIVLVDAGTVPTFGSGGFRSTSMALSVTRGDNVLGISGRAGEVYAVTEHDLLRSTGTDPFTVVRLPTVTNGPVLVDVHVMADGSVFVLGKREVFTCRNGCAAGMAAFTVFTLPQSAYSLCGAASGHVSVVTDDGTVYSRAMLWAYDGTSWAQVSNNLGVQYPAKCADTNAGEVVVAAMGGIAFSLNGATTVASPELYPLSKNEAEHHNWYSVATLGAEVWVGGSYLRSLHRDPSGTWSFFNDSVPVSTIKDVIAVSPTEVYSGGTNDRAGIAIHRFDGTKWVDGPDLVTLTNVSALYSPSPNVLYVGGSTSEGDPAIERLTR